MLLTLAALAAVSTSCARAPSGEPPRESTSAAELVALGFLVRARLPIWLMALDTSSIATTRAAPGRPPTSPT